ncbi:hypothetical protein QYQ99_00895 [Comamonas testosteroni]|uniref:hypothetical protein n=1 Tax=Comamonas testosteroni TaxID=285 RepID=UPI00265FFB2F|nr:hypothetical protein [Comamonas testosteroni]WKL16159.1 hypothetical protein QYQ99_00895 [Comamonas testosteroni]
MPAFLGALAYLAAQIGSTGADGDDVRGAAVLGFVHHKGAFVDQLSSLRPQLRIPVKLTTRAGCC